MDEYLPPKRMDEYERSLKRIKRKMGHFYPDGQKSWCTFAQNGKDSGLLSQVHDFIQNWKNVVGDDNCGFMVVSNFPFGNENCWAEIRRRMSYDLYHHMNVCMQLFGLLERVTELIRKTKWGEGSTPFDYWMDTPYHLYVIANTFNLCVVLIARFGSTTILPLYSNMDCTAGMLFIVEHEHSIQSLSLSHPHPLGQSRLQSNPTEVGVASPELLKPSKLESLESCMVSIKPHRLSSNPISAGCLAAYFHSYNPTWDTAECMTCKLEGYIVGSSFSENLLVESGC
ncbi:hypothetical protein M9H77_24363 [Catharanthus roseus]|uniref:Uncharacterized protein n=1 Tax=Catharanthus roseus TaxID=4058 RepID=A0ACC0AXF3_CATRO|nr:hypothetical protein M9H77_24363 [Catharanthus roseus]